MVALPTPNNQLLTAPSDNTPVLWLHRIMQILTRFTTMTGFVHWFLSFTEFVLYITFYIFFYKYLIFTEYVLHIPLLKIN